MNLRFAMLSLFACVGLSACTSVVPNDGPLLTQVASKDEQKDDFVYALVELESTSVSVLRRHDYYPLTSKFGLSKAGQNVRLGPGDRLNITIFEAGPDGIFSTQESKSVTLPLSVQQNGRVSVPFGGSVRAAGRTPGQVRASILAALRGRAVEPDVVVEIAELRSRAVSVNGAVNGAKVVPLFLGTERVLDAVAQAGGAANEPYNTYVSLSRGGHTRTALVQTLIDQPRENIRLKPDDSLYLIHDPRQFTALGAVNNKGRFPFGSRNLDLMEAAAVAGGFESERSNPEAFFVFRYEQEHVLRHLYEKHYLDNELLHRVLQDPALRDDKGRVPVVYRVDLSDADNFFVAKRFPVRANDTIYVARKGTVDFAKVVQLFAQARIAVTSVTGLTN